jgi:hypothetical protein
MIVASNPVKVQGFLQMYVGRVLFVYFKAGVKLKKKNFLLICLVDKKNVNLAQASFVSLSVSSTYLQ